ncbi:MAG TPA: hypothetical protein VHE30_01775 [Polyangiaceae bacterium]|nr:hypothetical protein [Polyangiaceae bacterium]
MSRARSLLFFPLSVLVGVALIGCGGSSGSNLFNGGGGGAPPSGGSSSGGTFAGTGGNAGAASSSGGSGGDTPLVDGGAAGAGTGGAGTGGAPGSGGSEAADSGGPAHEPCPTGSFTGTAEGSNYATVLGPMSVTADVAITVTADGTVSGTYKGKTPVTSQAVLSGTMNCASSEISLTISNGSYKVGLPPLGTSGTFTGTMSGVFSRTTSAFYGEWTVEENNPAYGGTGTWNAN